MMLATSGTSQSLEDKFYAMKYFLWGRGISLVVLKATTSELIAPKKKHLNYLTAMANQPNVSIPKMAKHLIIRARHQDWPVAFKSLITMHHLMTYGDEKFIQNIASSVTNSKAIESLSSFADNTTSLAHNMSKFVRRYARYINVRIQTYRSLGLDFCRNPQVNTQDIDLEQLLTHLPIIQNQFDTLLAFDASVNDLCNGIIGSAFSKLYIDFAKLYIVYQAFIIRLLQLFFVTDNIKDAKELLTLYKKFLVRMDKVSDFLPVIDSVGIGKSDMPNLSRVPSLPLKMLEKHVEQLEVASKRTYDRSLGRIEYGTLGRTRRRGSNKTPIRQTTIDILSPMAVSNYKKRNEELRHLDKMLSYDVQKNDYAFMRGRGQQTYDLLEPQKELHEYQELDGDISGNQEEKEVAQLKNESIATSKKNEDEKDLMGLDATLPTSPIYSKPVPSAAQKMFAQSPTMSILE